MRLPDGDGLDLLEWMQHATSRACPCAVITAHGNVESAVRALKLGAFDFVSKPLDLGALRTHRLDGAASSRRRSDASSPTRTGTQLIGDAPAMERLREMILRVARSQAPVHISGESGTGKELVARMIHDSGPRARGPVRAGELRRDSLRADGKRVLRPQARQLHRRGRRQGRPRSGAPTAARCSSTRSPTCRCTCRSSCCA